MSLFGALEDYGVPACTDARERFARLRLIRTPRVGSITFFSLIGRFGSAVAALEALPRLGTTPASEAAVEAELSRGEALGARLIVLGEADYPALLARTDAAPAALWIRGNARLFTRRTIAIVGARNASAAGQTLSGRLARELGEAGFSVVSGLARGIDARAHEASLATGTIAVIAGGIDNIYPPENEPLYQAIAEQGLIVSENAPGYKAQARDFPRRNRIISGVSLGVVVVEAELKSGSLITARLAGEQGREVFAVPGSPLDPRSRGGNDLLRNGASLCETAEDVIALIEPLAGVRDTASVTPVFAPLKPVADAAGIGALGERLFGLISYAPVPRADLMRGVGASAADALAALSELELSGRILCPDGFSYVRA